MKLKDIAKKYLKKESPSFLVNPSHQLLLEDLRSYQTINRSQAWRWFNQQKLKGAELFKVHRLCYNFVVRNISLKKNLGIFPWYKRGTRGFLLSDDAKALFPLAEQAEITRVMAEKDCKLCLFEHIPVTLPPDYIRLLK